MGSPAVRLIQHGKDELLIRRYIIWRNNHAYDQRLCQLVARANVA